jgi:dolichol-phosphate mannosyltransferase
LDYFQGRVVKHLSILIPVCNEIENVERAYEAVTEAMAPLEGRYGYEILFTDNHSTDGTDAVIRHLAEGDTRVRLARFSRNFGFQRSIFAGYALSSGDAAIQLDCDLQDPPALIPTFLEWWERDYQVVYGVRQRRKEPWPVALLRKVYYRLLNRLSSDELPPDAGDFRLIDRVVIDELTKFQDYNPYLRGSIAWMGFKQKGIPYDRASRAAGKSKFTLGHLIGLALDGLLAHSAAPLRLATYLGVFMGFAACVGAVIYVVGKFAFGQDWPAGFATLVLVQMLTIAMMGFFFGLIGEYLSRMFEQSKGRPLVIIESTANLEHAPSSIRGGIAPPDEHRNRGEGRGPAGA